MTTRSAMVGRRVRPSLTCALLIVALMIPGGPAHAKAVVFRFSGTQTETFTTSFEGCLPADRVGTMTLTETSTGQVVATGKNVYTVRGINVYDAHLDFPDGNFVQSWLNRDRYVFVASGSHIVYNVVTQDFRTIYAADGAPVGTLSIHALFHITYDDLNRTEALIQGR